MIRTILQEGSPTLRKTSVPVTDFGEWLVSLAADMVETCRHADGLGLAAPQVDVLVRLIVVALDGPKLPPTVMANPVIVRAEDYCDSLEGCLSVQHGKREGTVRRRKRIRLVFKDITGKEFRMKLQGWRAACVQHEIDHLNGVLFVDYLPKRTQL
jgi:peptide deformylase